MWAAEHHITKQSWMQQGQGSDYIARLRPNQHDILLTQVEIQIKKTEIKADRQTMTTLFYSFPKKYYLNL